MNAVQQVKKCNLKVCKVKISILKTFKAKTIWECATGKAKSAYMCKI